MSLWRLILLWPWYGGVAFAQVLRWDKAVRSVLGIVLSLLAMTVFGVLGAMLLTTGVIWVGVLLLVCCWVSVALWIKAMQSMP